MPSVTILDVDKIDIQAVISGQDTTITDSFNAINAAYSWVEKNKGSMDEYSEDALSHYIESNYGLDIDISDRIANNVLVSLGLKQ